MGIHLYSLMLTYNVDRQVPDQETGVGPVHLRSPMDENGPYHDDEDDVATLRGIDTEIPGARPTRKRSRECCMCCGMRFERFLDIAK